MGDLCPIWPKTSTPFISLSASIFFETLQPNGAQQVEKSSVSQFSKKKSPFQAKEKPGLKSVQNYLILYFMICRKVFLYHFGMMGFDRLKKIVLVIFPQKSSFNVIVQFGSNMGQNHATLCRWSTIVRPKYYQLIYLKIFLSGQGQFGANLGQTYATLCLRIHSLRIFLKSSGIMRCKRQTKLALVIFPKIPFWGNTGPSCPIVL